MLTAAVLLTLTACTRISDDEDYEELYAEVIDSETDALFEDGVNSLTDEPETAETSSEAAVTDETVSETEADTPEETVSETVFSDEVVYETETEPYIESAQEESVPAAPEEHGVDAADLYAPVLNRLYDMLWDYNEYEGNTDGFSGIAEATHRFHNGEGRDHVLYGIGDLNGDGIPELAIKVENDYDDNYDAPYKYAVDAVYTLSDGEPVQLIEGWARNMYMYMGEGRFYYHGSGGWAYSTIATYEIKGTELVTLELYHTDTDETGTNVLQFHTVNGADELVDSDELQQFISDNSARTTDLGIPMKLMSEYSPR